MAQQPTLPERFFKDGIQLRASVTIQRSAEELYRVWREFEQLARFIDNVEAVERDGDLTKWTVRGPAGRTYTWEARVINEHPGALIAWTTDEKSDVPNAGSVRFRELPFRRGTEVHAVLEYLPPGGVTGDKVAKALGKDPEVMVREALHQFRQLMEAGEVAIAQGQPVGANARRSDRPGESERKTDPELADLTRGGAR